MKNKKKRFISVMASLLLSINCISTSVFAVDEETAVSTEFVIDTENETVTTVSSATTDAYLEEICQKINEAYYDVDVYTDYENKCVVYKYCHTSWVSILKSYCEENGIDINYISFVPDLETISQLLQKYIRSISGSVTVDENEGIVVFQSSREDDITNAKSYCESDEIDLDFIKFVLLETESKPSTPNKIQDTRSPDSKLSDGVKKALDDGVERIRVYLIYKYNAQELSEEAHKRANEELATLDLSSYDEITLSKLEYEIFRKHHNQVCIDDRNAILNAIGADISDVNTTPWLNCTLTAEQILAAEEYEKILGVFLCDDEHFINDPLVIQYNTTTTTKSTDDNSITTTTVTDTTETTTTDTTTTTLASASETQDKNQSYYYSLSDEEVYAEYEAYCNKIGNPIRETEIKDGIIKYDFIAVSNALINYNIIISSEFEISMPLLTSEAQCQEFEEKTPEYFGFDMLDHNISFSYYGNNSGKICGFTPDEKNDIYDCMR
ncbi:MAG: hypothetical protein J6B01_07805, partial [Ruminococcus sp.]|nr:hypothetical protein [Ruminococcus sp.]